jgi:hypothetical protein
MEMRVLKLNHKAMRGTNISDVLFPGLRIALDKFLPFSREVVLPRTVPVGFLFGPGITIPHSSVRPVVDSVRATLGNNLSIATATCCPATRIGFNPLVVFNSKSHIAKAPYGKRRDRLILSGSRLQTIWFSKYNIITRGSRDSDDGGSDYDLSCRDHHDRDTNSDNSGDVIMLPTTFVMTSEAGFFSGSAHMSALGQLQSHRCAKRKSRFVAFSVTISRIPFCGIFGPMAGFARPQLNVP